MIIQDAMLENIAVGFLAGGQARRMGGGDKAAIDIGGKTILQRQMEATAHFKVRILNANGDVDRFKWTGFPLVPDSVSGFLGPLIGVLSCLDYMQEHYPDITHLQSFATDAPFVPADLTLKMLQIRTSEDTMLVQPKTNDRRHPVFTLWPVSIRDDLHTEVIENGLRKIDDFTEKYPTSIVDFSSDTGDVFMNVNRQEDKEIAEQLALRFDKL